VKKKRRLKKKQMKRKLKEKKNKKQKNENKTKQKQQKNGCQYGGLFAVLRVLPSSLMLNFQDHFRWMELSQDV